MVLLPKDLFQREGTASGKWNKWATGFSTKVLQKNYVMLILECKHSISFLQIIYRMVIFCGPHKTLFIDAYGPSIL